MKKIIRYVIYGILFLILIFLFIYIGTYDFKSTKESANERVALKFASIKKDNKFVDVGIDEAIKIVKSDGIILFANPDSIWADKYAYLVNEAAKETDVEKIAIIDITVERLKNSRKYQNLIKAIGDYAVYDDLGNPNLYMPAFMIVKDKKIIYFDNETAFTYGYYDFDDYWTSELQNVKKDMLKMKIDEYLRAE